MMMMVVVVMMVMTMMVVMMVMMMMVVMENSGGRPLLEKRITRPHIASHSALKGFSHTCKNIFILPGYFPIL